MTDTKFVVVVPVYNASGYIRRSIDSILSQTYRNFKVVVVDDGSTDGTSDILQYYRKDCSIFRSNTNVGSGLGSIACGIRIANASPNDVIITVDGDDWFAGDDALETLNQTYADPDIWMTYGQYEPLSKTYSNLCKPIPDSQLYRGSGLWVVSHLRTFRLHLWDRIKDEDLRDRDGEYFKVAWDGAFIFPMIEMCGLRRIRLMQKVLYIYNDMNPTNDMRIRKESQIATAEYIRSKPNYPQV
jgi:glycosyltransferase involved in cell wall biosynthesis